MKKPAIRFIRIAQVVAVWRVDAVDSERAIDLGQALGVYHRLFQFQYAGGLRAFMGAGPVLFGFQGAATAAWLIANYALRHTANQSTPWFVLLCALLIIFLGSPGSGRFIYAGF